MQNKAMQRKLACNAAIDLDAPGVSIPLDPADHDDPEVCPALDAGNVVGAKVRRLREFVDGRDYCIGGSEDWIWSIGRRADGAIFASTDSRFYQNPRFECLFLR